MYLFNYHFIYKSTVGGLYMYVPKRYGESKVDRCPFCGQQAFARNNQGIPVCNDHRSMELNDLKCACGSYLDMRIGKFGPFFICERCGTKNMTQALEMNPQIRKDSFRKTALKNAYKDETGGDKFVRSDDPRFEFR